MPVCNEVDVIEGVLKEWDTEVFRHLPAGSELLLNDCSSDGTEKILTRLQEACPYLRVLFTKREGFFKASVRLYQEARCPLIFFTDSDGQYVASEFWKIAGDISRFDIVHGAKLRRQDPYYRLLASNMFNVITRLMFGTQSDDVNSAFRLIRKEALEDLIPKIRHLPTLLNAEMLIRAEMEGYKVKSLGVAHRARQVGKSRGLPLRGFLRECARTYAGLFRLRREYRHFDSKKMVNIKNY